MQVGGRLIYSTCTFNPIEDEAVVAEVNPSCTEMASLWAPCQEVCAGAWDDANSTDEQGCGKVLWQAGPRAVQVLRCTGSSMELVDVSGQLPALKRMPGLRTWRVRDQRHGWVSSWQEASEVGHSHVSLLNFPF